MTGPVRQNSGYTLIELLLVCGLIGLMLVLAIPAYGAARDNAEIRGATGILVADIRLAQEQAVRSGLRGRVLFDTTNGEYQVQLASSSSAGITCAASSEYTTIKQVALAKDYRVRLSHPNLGPTDKICFLFEPSGRADWITPMVIVGTTTADGPTAVLTRLVDGKELPKGELVYQHTRSVAWREAHLYNANGTVKVILDFGGPRFVESVCPQMIEDTATFDSFAFPDWFEVSLTAATGPTPPTSSGQWSRVDRVHRADFAEERYSPDWARACTEIPVAQTTRYLKIELRAPVSPTDPDPSNPAEFIPIAVDEIRIPWPRIFVENANGRASREVVVTPNTGMVLVR